MIYFYIMSIYFIRINNFDIISTSNTIKNECSDYWSDFGTWTESC